MENRFKENPKLIVHCKNEQEWASLCKEVGQESRIGYGNGYLKSGEGLAMEITHGNWEGYSGSNYFKRDLTYINYKQINYSDLNQTNMTTNKNLKDLVPKDTLELVEAGLLNENLTLTNEGQIELAALVFAQHKATLIKIAQEKIKAAKKN